MGIYKKFMIRKKIKEKTEVAIYLNYKILEQVNEIKYIGITFHG